MSPSNLLSPIDKVSTSKRKRQTEPSETKSKGTRNKERRKRTRTQLQSERDRPVIDDGGPPGMPTDDTLPFVAPVHQTASGAALTFANAGSVLSSYITSFRRDPLDFRLTTTWSIVPPPGGTSLTRAGRIPKPAPAHQPPPDSTYHCQIEFPPGAALTAVSSRDLGRADTGWPSKLVAKRAASYQAVLELLVRGEMNDNLAPTPSGSTVPEAKSPREHDKEHMRRMRGLPASSGDTLTLDDHTLTQRWKAYKDSVHQKLPAPSPMTGSSSRGTASYDHILSPKFWEESPALRCKKVYVSVIEITIDGTPHKPIRDLCLFTSRRLPLFTDKRDCILALSHGVHGQTTGGAIAAQARIIDAGKLKDLDAGELDLALRWTKAVVRAQVMKSAKTVLPASPWAMVPLRSERPKSDGRVGTGDIAWAEMGRMDDGVVTPLDCSHSAALPDSLEDAVLSLDAEFSQRFYVEKVRTDLTPDSPHPSGSGKSITETALTAAYHPPQLPQSLRPDQPILQCSIARPAKTGGLLASPDATGSEQFYLIPELQKRYFVNASTYRSTSLLPILLWSLDDALIAQEMNNRLFDSALKPEHALVALTCSAARPAHPSQSYQRFEILGDALLKLITTLDIHIGLQSGALARTDQIFEGRYLLISNLSLKANAMACGIVPYIRSQPPRLKKWLPQGWTLETAPATGPNGGFPSSKHDLGDKILADVVEAIISAGYLSGNESMDSALSAMRALGILIRHVKTWEDLKRAHAASEAKPTASVTTGPPEPLWMRAFGSASTSSLNYLGYAFKDPNKAKAAIGGMGLGTSRSADFADYKMIGDALLDYFTVEDMYKRYPTLGPAPLTHLKHSRTNDACFAAFAVTSGLIEHLDAADFQETASLKQYKRSILLAQKSADDIVERGGRADEFWASIPAPTALGAGVEALFGAMLIDTGFDLPIVRDVYEKRFRPFTDKYCLGPSDHSLHPKSALLELLSGRHCTQWEIKQLEGHGSADRFSTTVRVHGVECSTARAATSNIATRKACEQALKAVNQKGLETLCDCSKKRKM